MHADRNALRTPDPEKLTIDSTTIYKRIAICHRIGETEEEDVLLVLEDAEFSQRVDLFVRLTATHPPRTLQGDSSQFEGNRDPNVTARRQSRWQAM